MNFINFMNFLEISCILINFMDFMKFLEIFMKNGKPTPAHARAPKSSPNHWNTKQIHRLRRGAIRPEITKSLQNHFFSLFSHFPPEIDKMEEFHEFWGNLAKRGSLGGPAPRSLFFLRNIKVSEPPFPRKFIRKCVFHEFEGISWNSKKFLKLFSFF